MSDDIVTRLRKRASWCQHGIDYDGAYQPYPRPESCARCEELKEIADEIERLRTLVADDRNKPVMEVQPVTSELLRRWT